MLDSPQGTPGFSREQKIGFIFMLVFAILTVSLGGLQLRNTIYGPFVVHANPQAPLQDIAQNDEARLKSIDTDHDGISDYDELYIYETSPYLADTDSDGISDKVEIDRGTDPLCPEGKQCSVPNATPDVTTSSVISPLVKGSLTPAEILSGNALNLNTSNPTSDANAADFQKLINDPVQLRAMILSTGKIDKVTLDKIDDATLKTMATKIFANQGTGATATPTVASTSTVRQ